jgi:predicted TIM-barrel fold metal-dependent hydrolase
MTDLQRFIVETPLADTHEHQRREGPYLEDPFDVLVDLFDNYACAELEAAGASKAASQRVIDGSDPDLESRFLEIQVAWERCLHTGYGEGVRLIARKVYGMEDITLEGILSARPSRSEGDRLRILRDQANLDHIQIDAQTYVVEPDPTGPDFFLNDLNWMQFSNGKIDIPRLTRDTNVEIGDLASLDRAMSAIFERYGPYAIAVKSQHAYMRTLRWEDRTMEEAEKALQQVLRGSFELEHTLCLGDWCLSRGAELAAEQNLPFKIHTGYMAGANYMDLSWIPSGQLSGLFRKNPTTRFVLMHTAYPYTDELIALAKHYTNVYLDLCWAWSVDPRSTTEFVRRTIHAVPSHKLFAYGGDSWWPNAAYAYSIQARRWLRKALQAEVDDGDVKEQEAMKLAQRFMMENQEECFNTSDKKRFLKESIAVAAG